MTKKNSRRPSVRPQQTFAFALTVVAASLTLVGAYATSAASTLHDAKALNFHLFDSSEFRRIQRQKRIVTPAIVAPEPLHEAAPNVSPCVPNEEAAPALEQNIPWTLDSLTDPQRDTLRKQLRIGGCPQDALPGYRALCELLLQRQSRPQDLVGPSNPHQ